MIIGLLCGQLKASINMKRLMTIVYILSALCVTAIITSCDKDTPEDWSEVVKLYVDAELGEYRPWGHPEDAEPLDGLKIKERKDADWEVIPIDGIDGFTHSLGWEFYLEVEKVYLANPPADASNIRYRLIKIVDEQKVRTPEFPTLEVKGAQGALANSYTANIFEPVHFYLDGNDYMQQDLRELCDSLVFDIPWLKGTHLSRKIYFHETGRLQLISGWDHRFILPMSGLCRIKAYKDGDVVYSDAISVSLTNEKDFLMYNWKEITESMNNSIGYVNFVDEGHEFLSTHYVEGETPIAKVSLSKPTDNTLDWLYEYLYKLYKEPLYTSESFTQEQYKNLFTDIDDRETPLYIWQTASSLIALIHYYDTDEDITQYYIKAEPTK